MRNNLLLFLTKRRQMKIEKYELNKKNNYNVYLSNGEVLELNEYVITQNELLIKKEIDKELYDKLQKDNKICELVNIGIKYINVRLRSIKEMEDYLSKKEEDKELITSAVDRLIKSGYLDDDKFTKAYIKDKLNFTTWGDYKIINELNRLGVSSIVVEDNKELLDKELLDSRMRKLIEKDIKTNKKYVGIKLKNKIYNHLITSGYSKEKVINIINNYNF